MISFVLDSSIALLWLMPDEVASLDILDKTITEGAIVPAIWGLEIGNVLLCAERAKPSYCKSTSPSNLYFKGSLHQN